MAHHKAHIQRSGNLPLPVCGQKVRVGGYAFFRTVRASEFIALPESERCVACQKAYEAHKARKAAHP